MPGISKQRIQQGAEELKALNETGNRGRGAVRIYADDAPSTVAKKQELLGKINAPPKASAAPVAGQGDLFVGLFTSLNDYQQELVKQKKRAIADQYDIVFEPPTLAASTVVLPGPQDASTAPMQNNNTAKKLLTDQQSVNRGARTWPVKAGTQIIKVIDDVMRNSSFITNQQNVEVSAATDPVTGLQTVKVNAKAGTGNMQWYKISVHTKDLGYDKIIRDHAYKITFVITPYAVAQMVSQYFPDSRYRGVHKAYQYWFTGANSQILDYQQSYNNAYRLALTGIGANTQKEIKTDFRDQNRFIYMATSENQAQGAKNYAAEPSNSAASFLYDPSSLSTVRLRIVGDPAWMQQGEAGTGVSLRSFDFKPFNSDGSINYDSQAVMFSVAFNVPSDYDLNTGLVNVNVNSRAGQPQEYYTFQAIKVKSTFSRGKFEQELEGKLLVEKNTNTNQSTAQSSGRNPGTTAPGATNTRTTNLPYDGSFGYEIRDETGAVSNLRKNEYGDLYDATGTQGAGLPTPQPSALPQPPSSSGDIASPAAGDEDAQQVAFNPPPRPATADQLAAAYNGVRPTDEETEARNAYIAAGAPAAGPLRDAYVSAQSAFNARVQQASNTGPQPNTGQPQEIARDA